MAAEFRVLNAFISFCPRNEFKTNEAIRDYILKVCSNPTFVTIDFSLFNLQNEDLNIIYEGLMEREKQNDDKHTLYLLNIASDDINEEGLKNFIAMLNKGALDKGTKRKIFPDVRQTVLRIGFPMSEDFFQELITVAPSVFAGSLKIIF
jgi:hypothetical protein